MRGVVIAPRWRKALRDIAERRGRSLLVVLAMAAGVFEIGAMLYKYELLRPELTTMYARTHPASATIVVDRVTDALVDSVRRVPGVADAEARPVVVARARIGEDEWVPAVLYVVRDFDGHRIDTFEREQGAWPPSAGQVLLERSALEVAKVAPKDRMTLRLAGSRDVELEVAGTVHAPGLAPAWMEHMVPGFVGWDSHARGGDGESAQIRIVTEHPLDEGDIRAVADSVKAMLVASGHDVIRVTVPTPGRHPHADQMEAFLFLLLAFGIASFGLSAVMVASTIHSFMAEQTRQIGMMKALGATDGQVAGVYLGQVGILASLALAIGIPAGLVVGRAYAEFAAGILNADLTRRPLPLWLIAVLIAIGLVVPLLVALIPVRRAARISVREALADDLGARPFGSRPTERWTTRWLWLPRPLRLAMRATFARRARLALTVTMLAIGGAVFMAALNVSGAWTGAVERDFRDRRWSLTVLLAEPRPIVELDALLAGVAAVERAEYWAGASSYLVGANGVAGVGAALVGPEPDSKLLALPLIAGRWLNAGDRDGAVINRAVLTRHPGLGVGDSVRVSVAGRQVAFPIVGVAKELAPMPMIYAPRAAVLAATDRPADLARSVRLVLRDRDEASEREAARRVERAFAEAGIEVSGLQRMLDVKKGILDHLVIIMAILTMASLIVVFVGGLALASNLTLSVVQRTREIGILGAIGATPGTIARHVWAEAIVIGLLSWIAACVLTAPISWVLEAATGSIFFKSPLDFFVSPAAMLVWLGVVVVIASLCSFYPARRAALLPVREALSHV